MKKVIVIVRKYHDMEMQELFPEVINIKDKDEPEDALRQIWLNDYNTFIKQSEEDSEEDSVYSLNEDNCWCEDDYALITFADGDTREFYVVEVDKNY